MTRFCLFKGSVHIWLWWTTALLLCNNLPLLDGESLETQITDHHLLHHYNYQSMQEDLLLNPPTHHNLHHNHHHHHHHHDDLNSMKFRATRRSLATKEEDLLQERKNLQTSIQIAAFQQFDGRKKTGIPYNVSVPDAIGSVSGPGSEFQAIRLRSGSLKRYGLTLNEFSLPSGCQVMGSDNPLPPERVLLVYSKLSNTSLFQGLVLGSGSTDNYTIVPPVLTMLVYDATYLNRSEALEPLTLSATESPITIQFSTSSSLSGNVCISFDPDSTNVSRIEMKGGVCAVEHLGSFANALVNAAPPPQSSPPQSSPTRAETTGSSDRWKAIVGGVVGGLALLLLISGLILFIGNKWRKARFAKMELQADIGEALQTTVIRNSRAPAAADTRTQPSLERDYTV